MVEGFLETLQYFRKTMSMKLLLLFLVTFILSSLVSYSIAVNSKLFSFDSNPQVYYGSLASLISQSSNKTIVDKAQPPQTCLIIIRSADGALGNRMFLFASAYGMARLHQCDLYVAPYILTDLRAVFVINISHTPVHLVTDDSVVINKTDIFGRYSACTLYSDLFRIPLHKNYTKYEMIGFYQAYGYFEKYRNEVAFLFQFNSGAIAKNVPLVTQLLKG